MKRTGTWNAPVLKKSHALFDGPNFYRRITIRRDNGQTGMIRVNRPLWKGLNAGDRLAKDPGGELRHG